MDDIYLCRRNDPPTTHANVTERAGVASGGIFGIDVEIRIHFHLLIQIGWMLLENPLPSQLYANPAIPSIFFRAVRTHHTVLVNAEAAAYEAATITCQAKPSPPHRRSIELNHMISAH
jgi:hypothetical protein